MYNKTLKDFLKLNEEKMEELLDFINTGDDERKKENGYNLLQLLTGSSEVFFWLSSTKTVYIRLSDWDECEGAYHINISFSKLGKWDEDQDFHFLHFEDFDLIKLIDGFYFN